MKEIYSISPFVRSETIPESSSVESIILSNFYLFNGYDSNPYIVRDYMNFIDSEFDFVFSKLKLSMVSYEYPENMEYGSWQMIEYINDNYNLVGSCKLDREYRLDDIKFKHPITGKPSIVRFNEYVMYDVGLLNKSIFNDKNSTSIKILRIVNKYFRDRKLKTTISNILDSVEYTVDLLSAFCDSRTNIHDTSYMCEATLILCQLKSYIKSLYEERSNV